MQVSYLLGIPAEQLLPPATSMPQLLPWPESVPPTPELLPQPAVTGNEPLQDPATQLQAADRQGGNAPNVQAQPRQPSDLILRLAAGAKAAQQQAPDQAAASPEGVSLKQPLQVGPCFTPSHIIRFGYLVQILSSMPTVDCVLLEIGKFIKVDCSLSANAPCLRQEQCANLKLIYLIREISCHGVR